MMSKGIIDPTVVRSAPQARRSPACSSRPRRWSPRCRRRIRDARCRVAAEWAGRIFDPLRFSECTKAWRTGSFPLGRHDHPPAPLWTQSCATSATCVRWLIGLRRLHFLLHSADGKLAPALQTASSLRRGEAAAVNLFRDGTSLAPPRPPQGDQDRPRDPASFLRRPRSAQSKWCQRELDYWIAERKPETCSSCSRKARSCGTRARRTSIGA